MTWKARPSARPNFEIADQSDAVAFALIAPRRTLVVRRAAVLFS